MSSQHDLTQNIMLLSRSFVLSNDLAVLQEHLIAHFVSLAAFVLPKDPEQRDQLTILHYHVCCAPLFNHIHLE